MIKASLLAVAGAALLGGAAFAQNVAPVGTDIATEVRPYADVIVEIGVGVAVGVIAWVYSKITGKKLDVHSREELDASLKKAAGELYNNLDNVADAWVIDFAHPWMRAAYDLVKREVPDALKRLGFGPDDVKRMVLSVLPTIPAAAAEMAAMPPTTPQAVVSSQVPIPAPSEVARVMGLK